MPISCSQCGTSCDSDARFCPGCGKALVPATRAQPAVVRPTPAAAAPAPPVPSGSWFLRRTIPFTLITAVAAALFALLRFELCFLAGLQGLGVGLLLGYIFGRIARSREQATFARRLRLCLWSGLVFTVTQVLLVSVLQAGPGDGALDWLEGVLDGYHGEPFFSVGKTGVLVRAAAGTLEGGAWAFFNALDLLLFAFTNLVGMGVGLPNPPGDGEEEEEGEGEKDA